MRSREASQQASRTHLPHPTRHLHWHIVRRRGVLLGAGSGAALLAVVGPGVLAGLSDDDPAGITTYSILGAKYGYELLWVLALSTAALIVFHELGVRLGIVTGKGLLTLVRERYGQRRRGAGARRAGDRQHRHPLRRVRRRRGRDGAARPGSAATSACRWRRSASRPSSCARASASVEHVLLALSSVFVAYVVSGFLAHPDWGAAAKGLVVPSMPLNRDAVLVAVATVGTTLAPWGLAFIQSYAVDKRLQVKDLRYERVDVIVGAVLTGVIGFFVVVACAATLHVAGHRRSTTPATPPGRSSRSPATLAATLFGLGFLGAALLAAAIVPLSTAYSVSETLGPQSRPRRQLRRGAPLLPQLRRRGRWSPRRSVLIPGAPLIPILFLSQALNAVLLLVCCPSCARWPTTAS